MHKCDGSNNSLLFDVTYELTCSVYRSNSVIQPEPRNVTVKQHVYMGMSNK